MGLVSTLLVRELRSALRERNLVVYSLLIPLLLYPLMMWVMLTGLAFVEGQTEGQTLRVAVVSPDASGGPVAESLAEQERLEVEAGSEPLDAALARLRADQLDLVVAVRRPPGEAAALPANLTIDLHYDGSDAMSEGARDRVDKVLREARTGWIEREALARGVSAQAWRSFEIRRENTASERDMGAFILGLIAPVTMIVMIAMGALYPAIDAVAGERERMTWETTLTLGVPRRTVVVAKYLYVATMASVAGLLNLAGMTAAMAMLARSSLMPEGELDVSIPPLAVVVVVVGTLVVALLVAALFLAVVPFARTFKEGQSMASPVFMLVFVPVLLADLPPEEVGLGVAMVPVANMLLVFKQVIGGLYRPDFVAVSFASSVVAVAACLWLATRLLRDEVLVLGAFEGSPTALLRRLVRRGR